MRHVSGLPSMPTNSPAPRSFNGRQPCTTRSASALACRRSWLYERARKQWKPRNVTSASRSRFAQTVLSSMTSASWPSWARRRQNLTTLHGRERISMQRGDYQRVQFHRTKGPTDWVLVKGNFCLLVTRDTPEEPPMVPERFLTGLTWALSRWQPTLTRRYRGGRCYIVKHANFIAYTSGPCVIRTRRNKRHV